MVRKKDFHRSDKIFRLILKGFAFSLIGLILLTAWELFRLGQPVLSQIGFRTIVDSVWNPYTNEYGMLPFIYGTLITSFLALVIAAPLSIGAALFLSELAPVFVSRAISFLVEMLAAIPSVVYGLWAIFVIVPEMQMTIQPWIIENLGFLPIFDGAPYGVGVMTASIVLAIMILPTVTAITREVFKSVPTAMREAALGLGATRWESIRLGVLSSSVSGMIGALMLGLGRALGETMAVTMVIGNRADISWSLLAPAQTMASVIANEYPEAGTLLHQSALGAVGLVLLFVSLIVNGAARLIVWGYSRNRGAI